MGFVIILFVICILWGIITGLYEESARNGIGYGIVVAIFATMLMCLIWGSSYYSYLDMHQRYAQIEQYQTTIEQYSQKAVLEFKTNGPTNASEITDLKYQNYQTQIGEMIKDLRDNIIEYNNIVVGKTQMKKSFMWSWCIVMPDEKEPLKMSDYIK